MAWRSPPGPLGGGARRRRGARPAGCATLRGVSPYLARSVARRTAGRRSNRKPSAPHVAVRTTTGAKCGAPWPGLAGSGGGAGCQRRIAAPVLLDRGRCRRPPRRRRPAPGAGGPPGCRGGGGGPSSNIDIEYIWWMYSIAISVGTDGSRTRCRPQEGISPRGHGGTGAVAGHAEAIRGRRGRAAALT
jgi:hypothetical protein